MEVALLCHMWSYGSWQEALRSYFLTAKTKQFHPSTSAETMAPALPLCLTSVYNHTRKHTRRGTHTQPALIPCCLPKHRRICGLMLYTKTAGTICSLWDATIARNGCTWGQNNVRARTRPHVTRLTAVSPLINGTRKGGGRTKREMWFIWRDHDDRILSSVVCAVTVKVKGTNGKEPKSTVGTAFFLYPKAAQTRLMRYSYQRSQ